MTTADFIDELTNGGRAVLGEGLPGECCATGRAEDSESVSRAAMLQPLFPRVSTDFFHPSSQRAQAPL
jgi:hypothetical protein